MSSDKPTTALQLLWNEEALATAPTSEPYAANKLWITTVSGTRVPAFSVGKPVSISVQPTGQSVLEGETATFSLTAVNATGYQWQLQESGAGAWADISGATSASYTTGTLTVASDNTDKYRCVVTNPAYSLTSDEVTLTVQLGVPSGYTGLWYAKNYSATPRPHIPNSAAATTPSNQITSQRRLFSSPLFGRTNTTVTDAYGSPPSGMEESSRVVWGSADAYLQVTQTMSAGTYTVSAEICRTGGSDQSLQIGRIVGALPDASGSYSAVTATATPQTFSHTFSYSSGGFTVGVRSINSSTPADFLIRDLRIHAGSSDLGVDTQVGNLLFRETPTVSGGYVAFGSNKLALAQFATSAVGAGMTMMAVGRRSSGSGFSSAITAGPSYTNAGLLFDNSMADAYFGGTNVQDAASGAFYANFWQFLSQGWSVFGARHSGTQGDYWLDDVKLFKRTNTKSAQSERDFFVGGFWNGGGGLIYSTMDVAAIAMWPTALSDAQYRTAYTGLLAQVAADGIANTARRFFVSDGDSITRGSVGATNGGYVSVFSGNASPKVWGYNNAVSGSQISHLVSKAALLDSVIPASISGRKFILSVLIGRNDWTSGASTSAFLADLAAYCDARRAAGWTVVLCTILPAAASGFNVWRNTVNTAIRTWVGTHCDAICDFAADGTIGTDAAGSNTSIYPDGTHPNDATHVAMEAIFRPVINAI